MAKLSQLTEKKIPSSALNSLRSGNQANKIAIQINPSTTQSYHGSKTGPMTPAQSSIHNTLSIKKPNLLFSEETFTSSDRVLIPREDSGKRNTEMGAQNV